MKIVINTCYGGFGLSDKAKTLYEAIANDMPVPHEGEMRTDPALISAIEQLGEEANTIYSHLEIVEIPDEATDWDINEYDGSESIIYVLDGKLHYV